MVFDVPKSKYTIKPHLSCIAGIAKSTAVAFSPLVSRSAPDLSDPISDALSGVIDETLKFRAFHSSVKSCFDIFIFLNGKGDLKSPVILSHDMQQIIHMRFILPSTEQSGVIILHDFAFKRLIGHAFKLLFKRDDLGV